MLNADIINGQTVFRIFCELTKDKRQDVTAISLKDGKPEFTLKQPFSLIAKRAPFGTRSTWGGLRDDFRTLDWEAIYKELVDYAFFRRNEG